MRKRILRVLGLTMAIAIIIASVPFQGVAFAAENSLKSSAVVSNEDTVDALDLVVMNQSNEKVAFLGGPNGQPDIRIGDDDYFKIKIKVPARADVEIVFPNHADKNVKVSGSDEFNIKATPGTEMTVIFTDTKDNGQVFDQVKVEYVDVQGKHILPAPLTVFFGQEHFPSIAPARRNDDEDDEDEDDNGTIINYITSWKEDDKDESYNLWIAADDMFKAYMNGTEVGSGNNYGNIYKFLVAVAGNDLLAARAADTDGTANIAGFKLILKTGDTSYEGTNTNWFYHIGDPADYNGIKWYEPGYMGDGWLPAHEVLIPENTWTTDWPTNEYLWIWAPKYDVELHDSIDNPVYFRNGNVDGIPPEVFIDPDSHTFGTPFDVTLTSDDNDADIFYKLDDGSFQPYTVPFEVDSTVTVTAKAVDEYDNESPEKSETYTLDDSADVDITPESTTFKGTLEVTIESTDGSTIYYTTDGTTPTDQSPEYSDPFDITVDTVVKALAIDDYDNEATDEESYVVDNETEIDIIPGTQTFVGDLEVSITSEAGAIVYYTTNGDNPLVGVSPVYTGAFTISVTTEVKAIGVDEVGNTDTDMETYTADTEADVMITPESQTFADTLEITITSSDGSTIYYTDDGTTPSESSTPYTVAFTIDADKTIRAFAIDDLDNTATDEESYVVDNETFVTITPETQSFNGSLNVSIASETDAVIYYTTTGDEPTTSSPIYSAPFSVSVTTTVKALAVDLVGNMATDMEVYTFDDSLPPLAITPVSQDFADPLTVTITSEGDNPIYYTTDGTEPNTGSTPYTGPFEVSETTTVKAIAYNDLETPSQVAMETYTFVPTVIITEPGESQVEEDDVILRYGYNRTPEEGYRDLEALITPSGLNIVGSPVWSISSNDNVINLVGNRVSYESAGEAEVTVTVTYYEGEEEMKTITDTVKVTVVFYATPSTPDPPRTRTPRTPSVSISLDKDPVELEYGSEALPELFSFDLTETITGSSSSLVTWSVGDDTIATVDENGVVTAVRQGETTVTVRHTSSGETDTSDVIVFLVGDEPNPLGLVEFYEPYVFGYPDQSFRPKNSVTRAEVATMFAKILALNVNYGGEQQFSDVLPETWYYNYVQAIKRTNIFVGDTEGNFRPNEAITRAEMATVFGKFWEYLETPVKRDSVDIVDVDSSHWASAYIYMMYNSGIVTGFPDGTYKPNDPTLREQVVGMINTLIARPEFEAPLSKFTDIDNAHWAFGNIEAASQPFNKLQNFPIPE